MIDIGHFASIGEAWLAVAKQILQTGNDVIENGEEYKEKKGISFGVTCVTDKDNIIERFADAGNIQWMKTNFNSVQNIKELHNANSYASRLYNYCGQKNQIEWVVDKIRGKKNVRSATITTFEPLTDVSYVPCVSLLDFDVNEKVLDVYVYARALDFGGKAYANMICIKEILQYVSGKTNYGIGTMHFICKSVHIYSYDYQKINKILEEIII